MSVACLVPEGSSPPPEPPPRDYHPGNEAAPVPRANFMSSLGSDGQDDKIRARMEACKQGLMQLEALRSKHQRMMQDMRGRLPVIPGCSEVQSRIKKSTEKMERHSIQSFDSGLSGVSNQISPSSRSTSPSISHRSSVSCDSGCSVYSTDMPGIPSSTSSTISYSAYRKLPVEDRGLPSTNRSARDSFSSPLDPSPEMMPIVATTIASTTCARSTETRQWRKKTVQRPRSMYDRTLQEESEESGLLDSNTFSQITPPPVHRRMGAVPIAQVNQVQSIHVASPPVRRVAPDGRVFGAATTDNIQRVTPTPRSPLAALRFPVNHSPPANRPLRTAQKPPEVAKNIEMGKKNPDVTVRAKVVRVKSPDVVFHASRIYVDRSPEAERKTTVPAFAQLARPMRPRSEYQVNDEPLYATPARVVVRDRMVPSFVAPSIAARRTAFQPVVSRVIPTADRTKQPPRPPCRLIEREWKESEGL